MSKQRIKCFTIKELYLSKIVKEVIKFDNGHNAMCITVILREIVVWFLAGIAKTARQGFSVILYLFCICHFEICICFPAVLFVSFCDSAFPCCSYYYSVLTL